MPGLDHFGLLAPLYDRLVRPPEAARLIGLADLPTHGRLLDAGGGTGRISGLLTGQARQILVADESWKMLSRARAKPGLRLAAVHAERLPFPAGVFDRVIMVDAYHHLRDQERSLAELLRVCAPGGRIVVEEPDIERVAVRALALFERLLLMRSRFRRADEIASGFRALGADASVHRQATTAWIVARIPSRA